MIDKVGTPRRIRSFQGSHVKPSHSLSYPVVPSADAPQLAAVRSEGPGTVSEGLNKGKLTRGTLKPPPHPLRGTHSKETRVVDDSSEESGAEEEIIVRIDSPSKLSFHQAS